VSGKTFLIEWRATLLASPVGSSARLVGLVLSTHMDASGGSCWPSIRLLREETRLSRNTIVDAVRDLEAAGLLVVERGSGTRSNRYRALIPSSTRIEPQDGAADADDGSSAVEPVNHYDALVVQSERVAVQSTYARTYRERPGGRSTSVFANAQTEARGPDSAPLPDETEDAQNATTFMEILDGLVRTMPT
jgi:hypothetical protein